MNDLPRVPCTGCQAPIFWVYAYNSGRRCPINDKPVANGNIVIRDGQAVYLKPNLYDPSCQPQPGEARYTSHFATCPDATEFRRK